MCETCEQFYQTMKEKQVVNSFNSYMNRNGWTKSEKYFVPNGYAYTNNKYILFFTENKNILYTIDETPITYWSNNFKENNLTKLCVQNNIVGLKEAPKKTLKVKIWTAVVDPKTCEHCKKLNGTGKSLWALFFININGKVYSLDGPPLHWVFNKKGQKIITCRCRLEYSTDKGILKRD